MANKEVKTLTSEGVTYDIKDAKSRASITQLQSQVTAIEGVIPSGTTTANKLVNASSVHDSTISFYQNNEPVGTITLNQGEDARLDFAAGGGGTGAADLFDFKFSDYQLNDTSWLRSDTFTWHNGIAYSNAYGHLEDDLETATEHVDWWASHITKVGALVDNEGVLSGFTGTTIYAQFPNATEIPAITSSFELVIKVHTPATFSADGDIFNGKASYKGPTLKVIKTTGVLKTWLSSNGTSWNIASDYNTGITLSPDTDYYIKLTWDGSQYVLSYSLDGEDYIDGTPIANTNPLYIDWVSQCLGGTTKQTSPWLGTIDLNESYIKVDGETVWEGCEYFTWYEAEDGHKIVPADQESRIVSIFSTTGVAWYYMIDTENQLFKLPRSKWAFVGLRDTVGKYVPESLPDHNHTYSKWVQQGGNGGGSYKSVGYVTDGITSGVSDENSVYQDGASVQQRATQMYLYFYVGTYTQSALAQTAGITAEQLNQKLDISKLQVVESLPSNPNPETWYAIAE